MKSNIIYLSDGTYIEIKKFENNTYQAAWIDPRNDDEALDFYKSDKACVDTWVKDLLQKIPPDVDFQANDTVKIKDSNETGVVLSIKYDIKLTSGAVKTFTADELEL